jgi:3-oxoacyl-[acyl-carrier-protein] synthase-1
MECQAFNRAGYADVPLHSLKGVYGHTLGAAGLIETIMGLKAMKSGVVLPSMGYENHGVSLPLNISATARKTTSRIFLKTSSGFGGCNAAAIFKV